MWPLLLSTRPPRRLCPAGAPQTTLSLSPSKYPAVRRDPKAGNTLHGVRVPDPYRWLEDPDSPETQQCG